MGKPQPRFLLQSGLLPAPFGTGPGGCSNAQPVLLPACSGACGAVSSACGYTTVGRLPQSEHPDVIVFYFSLIATPAPLRFAAANWVMPTFVGCFLLIGIGVSTQIGQVFLTRGLAIVPAARGTTIGYIQIVFASFWGFVLFDEPPNLWTFVGAAFVVLAVLLLLGFPSLARPKPHDHSTAHAD